jgi:UDP-N-acetylglucosamine 2-epimerase
MNRRVIDVMASYHFAPTEGAKVNLVGERVDPARIFVTGNTIVDALSEIRTYLEGAPALRLELSNKYRAFSDARIRVLVTGHRRESFGEGFENICEAIRAISTAPGVEVLYPVHLNPNVQKPVTRILSNIANVTLVPPIDYLEFVYLLTRADVIITDSGGVQEEAVSLGKSVLVMRDVTERPEGVAAGLATLVGVDPARILAGFTSAMGRMASGAESRRQIVSTYGDGDAARRIVDVLDQRDALQSRIAELRCAS